jgi:TetR/AcrR family transcriptional regulator, transcriptional repressor for nem operon
MLDNTQKKTDTRERILELAEAAVLAKGFASTSIEELIAAAGISKSGFFYHFKDKGELAEAMMERYLVQDKAVLDEIFKRADELNDDPLHGLLVALKLFAEMLANLPEAHPGCLAASFCYQDQLFNKKIRDMNAEGLLRWRRRFRERLDRIVEKYPPRGPVDLEALSDMVASNVEGG